MSVVTYPNITGIGGLGSATVTYATLLTMTASLFTGQIVRVSDMGAGALFFSDGTNWRPVDRTVLLGELSTPITTTATSGEQLVTYYAIPKGLPNNTVFRAYLFGHKSGTVETFTFRLKIGTNHTTADTNTGMSTASMATSGDNHAWMGAVLRKAATTVYPVGAILTGAGLGATASDPTDVTVSDMDANQTYFTFTAQASVGAETVTFYSFRVEALWPV